MRSTLDNRGWKRLSSDLSKSSDRDPSFKSCSDDEFTKDDLCQKIRSLETDLFAEYCAELPDDRVEQLCSRR